MLSKMTTHSLTQKMSKGLTGKLPSRVERDGYGKLEFRTELIAVDQDFKDSKLVLVAKFVE